MGRTCSMSDNDEKYSGACCLHNQGDHKEGSKLL